MVPELDDRSLCLAGDELIQVVVASVDRAEQSTVYPAVDWSDRVHHLFHVEIRAGNLRTKMSQILYGRSDGGGDFTQSCSESSVVIF